MINFEKYHGLGNDFIIFNYDNLIKNNILEDDFSKLAIKVCNRHSGIGADGVMIFVKKENKAQMIFINSDGSIGAMCGNGIRCFSNYIFNNKLLNGTTYQIETLAGTLSLDIFPTKNSFSVRVNMGKPSFKTLSIPMSINNNNFLEQDMKILDQTYKVSAILMGVPHAVIFVENFEDIDIDKIGAQIEKHHLFPKGINVNFVKLLNNNEIAVDTWERGAGRTLACGTGSCASVIIGNTLGLLDKNVTVHLKLGDLKISVEDDIFMTGPAKLIAKGELF